MNSKHERFLALVERRQNELATHSIVIANEYTKWWAQGEQTLPQIHDFFQQFYVFSVLFIPALMERLAWWSHIPKIAKPIWSIAASEIGADFSPGGESDGSIIRFKNRHSNWCVETGMLYGMREEDFNPRRGTPETYFFCNALKRLYGNSDMTISLAAADIVESTWAYGSGFWGELRQGLWPWDKKLGITQEPTFFRIHDEVEIFHAKHADEEFKEVYMEFDVNDDLFIATGKEMLDAIAVFWQGLDEQRKKLS